MLWRLRSARQIYTLARAATHAGKCVHGGIDIVATMTADVLFDIRCITAATYGVQIRWARLSATLTVQTSELEAGNLDSYLTAAKRHAGGVATTTDAVAMRTSTNRVDLMNAVRVDRTAGDACGLTRSDVDG
jgi:hypothetical protein